MTYEEEAVRQAERALAECWAREPTMTQIQLSLGILYALLSIGQRLETLERENRRIWGGEEA